MAAAKKQSLVLDLAAIEEDFFEGATLYGLRMPEESYYAAWFFKQRFGLSFLRNKTFFTQNPAHCDLYEYYDIKQNIAHCLYTNNKQGNYFIRSLRGFHYLWLVQGDDAALIYMSQLQRALQQHYPNAQLSTLDIDSIAERQLLIY